MKRKLSLAILMSLSALSSPSWSLDVGDARVASALGAPLEATIPLTDTEGLSPQDLTARLADAAAYRRAGLERSRLLQGIELAVIPRVSGLAIRLRSSRPVSDPYLDLLMELDGPSGRQQRQVTLLFDPPGFGSQSASVVVSGMEQPAGQDTIASVPPAAPSVIPRGEAISPRGAGYVDVGDTLWSVAERLRPGAGITMPQMMMGLLDANPAAFSGGNINRLKAGYVLSVPTRDRILARAPQDAKRQMQMHNRAFSRGEPVPEVASPSTPAPSDTNAADGALDVAAEHPEEREAVGSLEQAGVAEGAVPANDDEAQESTAPDVAQSSEPVFQEQSEARQGETADQPRLTLLTDAEVEAQAANTVASQQSERLERLEEQLEQSHHALASLRDEREASRAELASLREEVASLRASLSNMTSQLAAQAEASWTGAGFVDRYLMPLWATLSQAGRTLSGQLAAGGLAVLLALLLLVRRRRASRSIRPATADAPRADDQRGSANRPATFAEGEAVLERGVSESSEPLMPQAGAVSEADIFMAYGRYDQAQALLEEGLVAEPERHDLRLKLVKALVEQGKWQAVHVEAGCLAEDDDPIRQSELVRLLALEPRAPLTGVEGRTEPGGQARQPTPDFSSFEEPVDQKYQAFSDAGISLAPVESKPAFRAPIEREPMAFDDRPQPARPSWQEGDDVTAQEIGKALYPVSGTAPEDEAVEGGEPGDAGTAASAEQNDVATEPGCIESDQSDDGADLWPPRVSESNVIDYRPPPLELETDTPEEAPLQPSVDFSSSASLAGEPPAVGEETSSGLAELLRGGDRGGRGEAFGVDDGDWEVEEVAFEPLHLDNGRPAYSPPEPRVLVGEAATRLEQGDHAQARDLLDRALEQGDGEIREQAKRMIAQHNL